MTQYTKPQNSIVEPKEVNINIIYAFSINPSDEYQYWSDKEADRIKKATGHMTYIMRKYINMNLVLHIDVSRLGRIHWHGTLLFKYKSVIKEFYTEIIHELTTKATVDVSLITDIDTWNQYITKVSHLWDVKLCTNDLQKLVTLKNNAKQICKPIDQF